MKKLFVLAMTLGLLSCLAQAQSPSAEARMASGGFGPGSKMEAPNPNLVKSADVQGVARDGNTSHKDYVDRRGNTTLHEAAAGVASGRFPAPGYGSKYGVKSQVEAFLGAGVKPVPNREGITPVGAAVEGAMAPHSNMAACEGAVCALLEAGGQVSPKDKKMADEAYGRNKISGYTMMKIEERMREQEAAKKAAQKANK